MTPDQIITRAKSYIGIVTRYAMGGNTATCMDCSQFVWTVLGSPKFDGRIWWNTDRIYQDAMGPQSRFIRLEAPEVGCLAVYGRAQNGGHTGHVAFVVDPVARTIIDCSQSHDGVALHQGSYWWHHEGAIWVRFLGVTSQA